MTERRAGWQCERRRRSVGALLLLLAIGTSARAQVSPRANPLVIGQTFVIASDVLHEQRRINVYLPSVYADSGAVRLPVLYMPDGGMAEDFLHVAGLVQVLVGNGTMRPFILVGIENTERRRDLTGPTQNAEDRRIAPRVGGSADFRRFLRVELIPQIIKRYRTTEERAIVGESLAGLFVIETLLREPDLFDTYIAFDPSLWWNDEHLTSSAGALLRQQGDVQKRLFFASSNATGAPALAQRFAQVLEQRGNPGLQWQYQFFPDETHATIYHPAALRAFREMFKPAATGAH
ncbi:MAG: alpha/beta hydrolase-fold protein [Gemmatimonadaceae bacterium]